MNITTKIIITDTNIITDLNTAGVLEDFVKLENVYISDLVKLDEINSNTGDVSIINKFKVMDTTGEQLLEINDVRLERPRLSTYDVLSYILARDNDCILATGDKELRAYSLKHGVEVIRTLKIIELMEEMNVISREVAIRACQYLKENSKTRIPVEDIDKLIEKFSKDLSIVS